MIQSSYKNSHEQIQIIKKNLKNDLLSIQRHKQSIIFTGVTGSGKGTLIHYLMKNQRLYSQKSLIGQFVIKLKPHRTIIDNISISDKLISQTSMPHTIQYRKQIFRDLPGFMDNRNLSSLVPQDIINSFYINQVYIKTSYLKILYIASKNSLSDRMIEFVHSLNDFTERFSNINQIKKSIILIITKAPSLFQIENVRFILQKILNDLAKQINQNTKLLIKEWIESNNMIGIFKLPEKQGQLNFKPSDLLYEKIRKISYCPSPHLHHIISQTSQQKLNKLEDHYNSLISQICYQFIQSNYQEYLKVIRKIKMLNRTKSNLNFLRHKIDQLIASQTSEEFKKKFKSIPLLVKNSQKKSVELQQKFKNNELMKKFDEYYQFLSFFSKIQPKILNLWKWKQSLYKIHHNITQIVSQPWQQIHGQDIYIKGFMVQSSIIQQKINIFKSQNKSSLNKNKRKIVIFAYFFIMKDDIQFIGGNMMIYAQYFIVQEKLTKIRLNGQNGLNYSNKSYSDNKDGKPGKPGKNSGNLLLKIQVKCQNMSNLSIDLRGGQGGQGQDGGQVKIKGANQIYINALKKDTELATVNKKYLQSRQDYSFSDRNIFSKIGEIMRMLSTYNGQVVQYYTTQNQIEGNFDCLKYFKHTKGGAGGYPGHSGRLHLHIPNSTVLLIDKAQSSLNGFGQVQVYQGYFVKQMIFPNFREEGKQINLKTIRQEQKIIKQQKIVEEKMKQRKEQKMLKQSKFTIKKVSSRFTDDKKSTLDQADFFSLLMQAQQQILFEQTDTPLKKPNKVDKEQQSLQNIKKTKKNITKTQTYDEKMNKQQLQKQINNDLNKGTIKKGNSQIHNSHEPILLQRKPIIKRKRLESNSKNMLSSFQSGKQQKCVKEQQKVSTVKQIQNNAHVLNQFLKKFLTKLQKSQNLGQSRLQPTQIMSELGKQFATDIGTEAVQKLTEKFMNKVWDKIVRSGLVMQKQVLKQFVQNASIIQAQKQMIRKIGIISGENMISQEFAKLAVKNIQQKILTNYGKQIVKDSAMLLQKQAFKHLSEDIAKQGLKKYGVTAIKQAQIHLTTTSLYSTTAYLDSMFVGLAKSVLLQFLMSMLMSSGVTDGWLVKPHFKSKKIDLIDKFKCYINSKQHQQDDFKNKIQKQCLNYTGIQQPQPFQDFRTQQILSTQQEYRYFINSFEQLKIALSDKY